MGAQIMTSAAALAFLEGAVEDIAPSGDRRRRLSLTQAELARRCGRSPGTVAYYLAKAGPEIVTRGWGGVLVDVVELDAARARIGDRRQRCHDVADELARRWGSGGGEGQDLELLASPGRAPTVSDIAEHLNVARSTAQRHLRDLGARGLLRRRGGRLFLRQPVGASQEAPAPPIGPSGPSWAPDPRPVPSETPSAPSGQLLAAELAANLLETALNLANLAERLLAGAGEGLNANPRADARNPRDHGAQIAGIRERTGAFADSFSLKPTEKERKLPSSREVRQPLRAEVRGSNEPVDGRPGQLLTDVQLDDALAPLLALCVEQGFRHVVDDRGREILRPYRADHLEHAVAHVCQRTRAGGVKNPLGILVAGAERGDRGMFSPPPEPGIDAESPSMVSARNHARLLASVEDLDDEERRSMLIARCRGDQAAVDAGLDVLAAEAAGCPARTGDP